MKQQSPTAELDRRGFLKISGGAAMLSLSGGTAVAEQFDPGKLDAVAWLIGPAANRPAPGSAFFDNKISYHFIYWETDDSGRWEISESDSAWSLIPGSRKRLLDVLTNDVSVSNTTTETTVFESTVGANGMMAGDVYSLLSTGNYTTVNSSEQFTLRFYLGSTPLGSITSVAANVTSAPWSVELMLTVRGGGAAGVLKAHTRAVFNNVHDDKPHGTVVLDTEQANTFSMTIQWDEANPSDEVLVGQASFERLGTA